MRVKKAILRTMQEERVVNIRGVGLQRIKSDMGKESSPSRKSSL